jgi:uncharacterized UBP type Zn finger protein
MARVILRPRKHQHQLRGQDQPPHKNRFAARDAQQQLHVPLLELLRYRPMRSHVCSLCFACVFVQAPCGFKNQGNQCFAICAVQLVLAVPVFLKSLLNLAANTEALDAAALIVRRLSKLAVAANTKRNQHRAMQDLLHATCYGDTRLSPVFAHGENDAGEFLHHLFDFLREQPLPSNPFSLPMRFRLGSAVHCQTCGRRTESFRGENEGPAYRIHLSATQCSTPSFGKALSLLTATNEVRQRCEGCHVVSKHIKHAIYQSPPQLLFVHIERWSAGSKCLLPVAVPSSLQVDIFGARYRLLGAGVHKGKTVASGHWVALVSRSGTWFSVSDSDVEEADLAATLARPDFQSNVAVVLLERDSAS